MRILVLLCALTACDPIWHVDNVATAKQPTTPTEQCVEAGIKATGFKFSDVSGQATSKPARDWYVNGTRVQWDPKMPTSLKLGVEGVGTEPPPGSVDRYRATRATLLTKLAESCGGQFDVSAEDCGRVKDCATTPASPTP